MVVKKRKHAVHFPMTRLVKFIGAEFRVSKVPSFFSSARLLMVRKGTRAGEPKNKPSVIEDSGVSIQSVWMKLSIKYLKPTPISERK